MSKRKHFFPIATALLAGIRKYNAHTFKDDLIAGLIVSLIALPLAMALAIAVGLPPQHGLYTAIVAGIAAALLGGSMTQVSGPTAAFVVIVAPIISDLGLHGIVWCQIIAGIMLVALGTARLGKLITYVPYPVTMGFTAGIGVVIGTLALNDFFGLGIAQLKGDYIEKVITIARHFPELKLPELAIGAVTLAAIAFFGKITDKIPSPVIGIALGTLLAWIFSHNGIAIDTLGTRFSYETAEGLKHGIPPYPPVFHLPTFAHDQLFSIPGYAEFKKLLGPSMVIAALAALESLLSATVADSMAGTRHNPNAELNGIGIANVLSGLASGIPATGAIARTSVNIHAGAKTPLASAIHALFILIYVLTLSPFINHIPMAALAALLLSVAWRMSHAGQFIRTIRIAPHSDVAVLVGCFGLTVFIDMVAGVTAGMILATLLFMKRISESTTSHITSKQTGYEEFHGQKLPAHVMIYHINGPLFFGTVEHALDQAEMIGSDVKKLIIDLARVPLIDMTGMVAMKDFLNAVAHDGRTVIVCGKKQVTDRIMRKIEGHRMEKSIHVMSSIDHALAEISK
ncbi:MAG: STAS domain-containing protein [Alphaproteobacteria bacterium]|nr:STAS domain-containing protein [Alphaproteobacteria bacterium]